MTDTSERSMKRLSALFAAALFAAAPVSAQITFDDLSDEDIVNGYAGYNWSGWHTIDGCNLFPLSGYCSGTVSQTNVALNWFQSNPTITSPSPFLFGSGWFTSAWNTGLQLDITGLFQGNTLFFTTLNLNTAGPVFFAANWAGIDELRFDSYGGVDADAQDGGSGTHFALDDLSFEATSTVPEPATMTLLATGLAGMAAARRRKKA